MRGFKRLWRKLAFVANRRQFERDLEEEMRLHREMAGATAFGNATLAAESSREVWSFTTMETFFQDLRYALRALRRAPAFTAVAIASLALGIGANSAIFSLIDTLMLKTLPVRDPGQLVELETIREPGKGFNAFSYPTYEAFRDRNHVFSGLLGSATDRFYVQQNGASERVEGQYVSENFFTLLGLRPYIGQLETHGPVAVISYSWWQRRYGLDPSVLGRKIAIEGVPFTIVGVTPPGFFGIQIGSEQDITIPLETQPQVRPPGRLHNTGSKWIRLLARLKPGVPIIRARAEVATIFRQTLSEEMHDPRADASSRSWTADVHPAGNGLSRLRKQFSKPLVVLMSLVALVLLIACANVANLLLARSTARQREIAIRVAIGAGRFRLIRQMLTESLLLAAIGGALGLAMAAWTSNYLVSFMATGRDPITLNVRLDARVLLFTIAASIATALLFGLAPAFRGAGILGAARVHGGQTAFGRALVVTQLALSMLLLAGAGLFVRTLVNLETIDLGFDRDRVLLASLDPSHSGYSDAQLATLYRQLLDRLGRAHGVRSASASFISPIGGGGVSGRIGDEVIYINYVAPRYFETLGTPFLRGHDFAPSDGPRSPKVVIINESLARHLFGNTDPIGRRVTLKDTREVIGVVRDAKYLEVRETPPATAYLDMFQQPRPSSEFELRTYADPRSVVAVFRSQVRDLTKGRIAIGKIRTLTQQVDASIVQQRLIATLSAVFGALGVVLACIGLYGLLAYAVARRTAELGIRMALGAARASIVRMVVRDAAVLAALGVAIGIPIALTAARFVSSELYGVSARDPLTIAGAAISLLLVALAAAWIPARRASRVDPMVALRYE